VPHPRHRTVPGSVAPVVRRAARAMSLTLVVALVGVLGALSAGVAPAAAAGSCSGPLDSGQIRVVMVVDPGETGPRAPQATCLVVAAGTSGSKVLAQRASELGLPSPRYTGSGLLCGLDGFPETACPVNNGGSYAYWAYFNGSGGGWSFGHDNPFVRRMVDGEIMGWRYTTGSADGDAPIPRIAPSGSLFPPLTPATTAPAPAPLPSSGASSSGSTGGAGAGAVGGSSTSAAPSAPVDPAGPVDATGSTDTTLSAATSAVAGDGSGGTEELAAAPASSSGADRGRWVGLVIAVTAVGALAVGAVTRSRARSRS
jgi:hypothetical protein